MASFKKAKIISDNECRIRIKETGEHKIVRMIPLKTRVVERIDKDGDKYFVDEQDYILVDGNTVLGFLCNPHQYIMNDILPSPPFSN